MLTADQLEKIIELETNLALSTSQAGYQSAEIETLRRKWQNCKHHRTQLQTITELSARPRSTRSWSSRTANCTTAART